MFKLKVKSHFDAAHYIKDYVGKCSRMHGHRWEVVVELQGKKLDKMSMLVDFTTVKRAMDYVIDSHLDHYVLNETLGEENLTAEYLAEWFFRQMRARAVGVEVVSVTIYESPDCSVTYSEGVGT